MIALLGLAIAAPPTGHVGLVVGGRTSPESSIQVPGMSDSPPTPGEAEDLEFEPSALFAVDGSIGHRNAVGAEGSVWGSLDASAWLLAPEGDASRTTVRPALGASFGAKTRIDLAGRYLLDVFPAGSSASSGRFEALARLSTGAEPNRLEISTTLVDRHFFRRPEWSFRALDTGATWKIDDGRVRSELGGSFQVNQGFSLEGPELELDELGTQVRGVAGLGVTAGAFDLMVRYRPIVAFSGELDDDTVRAQFTPLGDYAADADAVSGGGFLQHRLELDAALIAGRWTLRGGALGRSRTATTGSSLARTGQANLGLDRRLSDRWLFTSTVGVTAAELTTGAGFVDGYGWAGVRWEFGP